MRGARWQRDLAVAGDPRNGSALDQDGRVVDRGAAVARDHARALEQHGLGAGCVYCECCAQNETPQNGFHGVTSRR
jgi:hypothetical protein